MPDWNSADAGMSSLENRLNKGGEKGYLREALKTGIPDDILKPDAQLTGKPLGGIVGLHLWLRMLFSCLVDACFLDTEAFMDPAKSSRYRKLHNMVNSIIIRDEAQLLPPDFFAAGVGCIAPVD